MDAIRKAIQLLGVSQTAKQYEDAFSNFNPNKSQADKMKTVHDIEKRTNKAAMELGSYIPGPGMLAGGATGAMQALSQDAPSPTSIALSTLGGAGMGLIGSGTGKMVGVVGGKLADAGENLGLRRFGLSKLDVNKLEHKMGVPIQEFLAKNGLIGKSAEDVGSVIKPLQEQFDQSATDAGLKVDPNKLLDTFAERISQLKSEAAPELQKKGADLEQYANNLFNKIDDSPNAAGITKERRTIDNLVKDFQNSGDAVNASKNRMIRDLLQGSVQDAATGAGIDLKGLGNKLSNLYSFSDVAEKRAPQPTGAPAGLLKLLGLGAGGNIGGIVGGIPGAAIGGAIGMGAESVMNNPEIIKKASLVLPKIGNTVEKGGNNFANNQGVQKLLQVLGVRMGEAASSVLAPRADNPQSKQEDQYNNFGNNTHNLQNSFGVGKSPAGSLVDITNVNPNIPNYVKDFADNVGNKDKQRNDNPSNITHTPIISNNNQNQMQNNQVDPNMEVTLTNGQKTTYGALQSQGAFKPAQTVPQQSNTLDRDKLQQIMLADLFTTGGKHIDQLKAINDVMTMGTGKQLEAGQIAQLGDFDSGKQLLNNLTSVIDKNKTKFGPIAGGFSGANPYDTEAQDIQSQIMAAVQQVGRAMEGGVLRNEDVPKYQKILPNMKDTPEVAQRKIQNVMKQLEQQAALRKSAFTQAGYNPDYGNRQTSGPDLSALMKMLGK